MSVAIQIVDYDSEWPLRFQEEAGKIRRALGPAALRIEHVGSTSVPQLAAKPVIDILLEVANSALEDRYAPALESADFALLIREPEWHEHRMFRGAGGDVNLHVFSTGCGEIARMLAFRDRLRGSATDRELYLRTKRTLARQDWPSTQDYADAKTAIVEEILARRVWEEK